MCFSGLTNIFFYFKKCNMIPFLINIEVLFSASIAVRL